MRLIDADALAKKCGDWYVEEGTEEGFIGTLRQLIDAQPEQQAETCDGCYLKPEPGGRYDLRCGSCKRFYADLWESDKFVQKESRNDSRR